MKELTQKAGVRRWSGDEIVRAQSEPLYAIQQFFKTFGKCVLQGCTITPNGGNWDISAGLVAVQHPTDGFKVAVFDAVTNVALPGYLSITKTTRQKNYKNTGVDDVEYEYKATLTAGAGDGSQNQLDVISTGTNTFIEVVRGIITPSWVDCGTAITFVISGGGSLTASAADIKNHKCMLMGKTLIYCLQVETATVSGTPTTAHFDLPAAIKTTLGLKFAKTGLNFVGYYNGAPTLTVTTGGPVTGADQITISNTGGFVTGTDNQAFNFTITAEMVPV